MKKLAKWLAGLGIIGALAGIAAAIILKKRNADDADDDFDDEEDDFDLDQDLQPEKDRGYVPLRRSADSDAAEESSEENAEEGKEEAAEADVEKEEETADAGLDEEDAEEVPADEEE